MLQQLPRDSLVTARFSVDRDRHVLLRRSVHLDAATRGVLASLLLLLAAAPLTEDVAAREWLTGPDLQRALARPASVTWTGRAMRDALLSISAEYQVATMLDRRVDPGRFVQLSINDKPLSQLLEELARGQQTSMAWVGPVAYFGPTDKVRQLRTLLAIRLDEASQLPAEVRREVMRKRSLEWDQLATPRELLQQVADRCQLSISNVDQLPHDLWAAGALPPLNLVQTLAVLGAGFDATFRIDGAAKSIRIEDIPARLTIDRFYSVNSGSLDQWVARLTKVAPEALVKPHRGQIAARARIEDHDLIAATIRGEKVGRPAKPPRQGTPPSTPQKVYSLKVAAPLKQLVSALGRQAGFEVRMQTEAIRSAEIDLDQVVTVDVKEATLDELLRATLRPAGLDFRRNEGVVEIFPAAN